MGIALSLPEDSNSSVADGFTKNSLEGARVGSISFKGRDLETETIGSISFKHTDLQTTTIGSISFKGRNLETATIGSISFKGRDLETATIGSISFRGRDLETATIGSISFKGRDLETAAVGSISRKGSDLEATVVRSVSFKGSDLESASMRSNSSNENVCESYSVGSDSFKEEAAALKLQKVYKSYRTRRNLADCAVVVEELWWKAIDFVTLKRSTVSFFDIGKPETAISRWSRARTKAAKVGKGLSKDDKARKLAFQHWLEAIDPRHRYGHNLHFYYDAWFETDTVQPFFYWLDVGDGRDLNLEHCCPRGKLQQQCIKYLGPKEREQYEVVVKNGKLVYKHSGQLVDTSRGLKGSKWIFVLSTSKGLYVGQKSKGTFQHSSFLAGGATSAAGRLVVDGGVLKSIWPYSGHYLPTEENFNEFINFLEENSVDLTNVQKSPSDEDEPSVLLGKDPITASGANSEAEREERHSCEKLEENDLSKQCAGSHALLQEMKNDPILCPDVKDASEVQTGKISTPQQRMDSNENANADDQNRHMPPTEGLPIQITGNDNREAEKTADQPNNQEQVCYKRSLSDKDLEDQLTEVPHKSLLQRLHSKKALQSYQLGRQLSFKWSTGAGPRIVCVADYPSELRVRALEKVNLSPRCMPLNSPVNQSPRCMSLNSPRDLLELSKQLTSPKDSLKSGLHC